MRPALPGSSRSRACRYRASAAVTGIGPYPSDSTVCVSVRMYAGSALKPYARRAATTCAMVASAVACGGAEPLLRARRSGRHEAQQHGGDEEATIQAAFGSYENGS